MTVEMVKEETRQALQLVHDEPIKRDAALRHELDALTAVIDTRVSEINDKIQKMAGEIAASQAAPGRDPFAGPPGVDPQVVRDVGALQERVRHAEQVAEAKAAELVTMKSDIEQCMSSGRYNANSCVEIQGRIKQHFNCCLQDSPIDIHW